MPDGPLPDNRWCHGRVEVVFPPLPRELVGQSGTAFRVVTVDAPLGAEVVLEVLDDAAACKSFEGINRLDLHASTMVLRTSAGPIAVILWRFAVGGRVLQHTEHPLHIFSAENVRLLRRAEQQRRLKVFIRENRSGRTVNFFEFDNTFGLGSLADGMEQIAAASPPADWRAVAAAYQREVPLESLIEATESDS